MLFIIWALAFGQVIMRKNLVWHAALSQISDSQCQKMLSMDERYCLVMVYGTWYLKSGNMPT